VIPSPYDGCGAPVPVREPSDAVDREFAVAIEADVEF
jgi:hypothetical protein